ncbi:MAG TPA: UDP-4-amino-4,6-dideoxy-N-acetyl-beta-L-altrosamine transaminase [Candidatus Limnocylindrales bacterium]|nr:UDP-4-amino-4,6-dideoxy-N-acetyl-beta-L-altrosamine transaminase [Candidatus Limnocylindrales bacterium]
MPDTALPYGRQWIDDDDVVAVVEALRSDFLTTGPRIAAFEQALSAHTGGAQVAVVSSGTAALHAAYAAIGIGPGDEVIMPPLTFAATGNAALYLGARPVFVDIEGDSGLIDAAAVEAAIGPRTRAIVAVDYTGHPADYDALDAIANRHGLALIADAAHALGATYHGRAVGTLATLTTLSFHPVKHITTAEGGAVAGPDAVLIDSVRTFRNHGIVRDEARFRRHDGAWYHEMQSLGFNYRITDVGCALGLSQLRRLDAFLARRRAIAARYTAALATVPGLSLPAVAPDVSPAWHLYVIRTADPSRRRPLFDAMRRQGLGVQVHYIPVYRHPYYEDLGYSEGLCPKAEGYYARAISIPIFPAMSDADVERVITCVADAVRVAA